MKSGFKITSPITLRYDRISIETSERNSVINIYKDDELLAYKIIPGEFHIGDVINLTDMNGELKLTIAEA